MTTYNAPMITDQRSLNGRLNDCCSKLPSDADIKHHVEPVTGYEAPTISAQQDLQGELIVYVSDVT